MAKTPSKTCVDPKCGTVMHARQLACPKCKKEQPPKAKLHSKAKSSAPKSAPRRPAVAGGIEQAVDFVRQVGGLNEARKLMSTIDEIKKL